MIVSDNAEEQLDQIAAELRVAAFRLTRRLRIESHVDEATDSQLTVLMRLSRTGPSTPGALAEFEGVSPPSMNRTVNVLEAAGYVRRVDDPADGRRVIVEVTDAGAELAGTVRRRRNDWLKAELGGLTDADRATLSRAIELLDGMTQP
jgi:DNA-binding MarR family transcriptional regulator